jgi:error-prone DNA polymerase
MSFIHLHVHTNFSFGDGAGRIDELVQAAQRLGMPALAITDHDGLYGAVRFYQACKAAGVKPIVGVEISVESIIDLPPDALSAAAGGTATGGRAAAAGARRGSSGRAAAAGPLATRRGAPDAVAAPAKSAKAGPGCVAAPLESAKAEPGAEGALPSVSTTRGDSRGCRTLVREARPRVPDPAAADAPATASAPPGPAAADAATAAPFVPHVSTTDLSPSPPRGQFAATGYHLVLLARDYQGWSQLCRIVSAAHLEHRGEPPLVRAATLAKNHDHLIALSGCRRGEVGALLSAGDKVGARAAARRYAQLFEPGDFFIELIDEQLPDSARYVQQLDLLARELRLPTVASNDVHYLGPADAPLHDILAAEAANQPLPNPLGRRNSELSFKTPGQMWRLFCRYPQAYRNATRIAARCNLDLGLGRLLFPAYPLPPGETAYSLLSKHCFTGAAERYSPLTPAVLERLERELKTIEQLGFAEYFLAVRDIVEFTRARDIYYSGRGSAGNSIVSYVLHITDADPIANELLFERFLNPARHEMPDIDIDFESARRDEVIEYIYERFGHDRVAMVATVNTVRAPSAVRIVARAFDFRPDEVNALSRRVPWGSAARLSEMLAERPELANHEFQSPHYKRLVNLAERLSGFPYILGTHLGGFILSRDPLTDRVPLQWAAKGVIVAQFDKDDIETLGLVKMDILGLRMHSAIAEAVRLIEARTGERLSAWELPRDDPAVYKLISEARTIGVFQLESSGQRNLATRLRQRDFEDVIAAISLFRPGPLQAEMIGPFIRRRHGREKALVPHPDMWPALKRTYGVILYQEQVIEVAAAIAGFSLAEGDLLRRAMTHERSLDEMDQIGRDFVAKAVARGIERATADEVFRQLRGFAAYGFNKAHAACFAVVCNASAWLKAYYPAEFFCGLMDNQPMGFYSPRVVLNDARRWGLEVLPVDANLSVGDFAVERDGRALRVGLTYVKEMSQAAGAAVVRERALERGGPYRSLADFCRRTRVSVEIVINLVRVGAFDELGVRREELLVQVPLVHAQATGTRGARGGRAAGGTGVSGRGFAAEAAASSRAAGAAGVSGRSFADGSAGSSTDRLPREERPSTPAAPSARGYRAPSTERLAREGRPSPSVTVPPGSGPTTDAPSSGDRREASDTGLAETGGEAGDGSVLAATPDEALQFATDEQLGALPFVPSWSAREKVAVELEVLGLNVSAHPLDFVRAELTALDAVPFGRLHLVPNGRRIRLAGVLERAQMPWIRSGHRTLFLTLEDESGLAEVVVFNDVYLRYGRVLKEAVYLLIEGELQNNDERGLAVVATRIVDLEAVLGRLRDLPPDDRNRALKRSGEWLPKVEPRTRPGRTG